MSLLGNVVVNSTYTNFYVVVSEQNNNLKGIELVQGNNDINHLRISKKELLNLDYRGRKLDNCSADLTKVHSIKYPRLSNFEIRSLAVLSDNNYCKLLRNFVNVQNSIFGDSNVYNIVRDDVHSQLVKMIKKGIYGV